MIPMLLHSDRVPSFETGTPTFHYAAQNVDRYRAGLMVQGPLNPRVLEDIKNTLLDEDNEWALYCIPPWDSANRKPFDNLLLLSEWLFQHNMPLRLIMDDLHYLKWMSAGLRDIQKTYSGKIDCFTNFVRPEKAWASDVPAEFHFWPDYPFDQIQKFGLKSGWFKEENIQHEIGYCGRYFPKRLTILKRMGWRPRELILLGPGWHKQDNFECSYAFDGGQPWIELAKLYRSCRWHLVVQDKTQNEMWPAVSRVGECLASGRPMLFHSSFVAGRPNLDWSRVQPYVVKDAAGCREAMRRLGTEVALQDQIEWAKDQYYTDKDRP